MTLKTGKIDRHIFIITGVCGFLGWSLWEQLIERDALVIGVDIKCDRDFKESRHSSGKQKLCIGDYDSALEEAKNFIENHTHERITLIHMAGLSSARTCEAFPVTACDVNISLTVRMLEFCKEVKASSFIFPSTAAVYGTLNRTPICEDAAVSPSTIYATTKIAAEKLIECYTQKNELCAVICRLSNVYGPSSTTETVIGKIINQARERQTIKVWETSSIRDFIFVRDVIDALMHLAVTFDSKGCHRFNVSTGEGVAISELIKELLRISPNVQCHNNLEESDLNTENCLILDNTKLKRELTWYPKTSIKEGLSMCLNI